MAHGGSSGELTTMQKGLMKTLEQRAVVIGGERWRVRIRWYLDSILGATKVNANYLISENLFIQCFQN